MLSRQNKGPSLIGAEGKELSCVSSRVGEKYLGSRGGAGSYYLFFFFPQRNLRSRGGVGWGNNIGNVRKPAAPNLVHYSPIVVYQKNKPNYS